MASQRLQSLLRVQSREPWPLPPAPRPENKFLVEMNREALRRGLADCLEATKGVRLDRTSANRELIDVEVKHLEGKNHVVRRLHSKQQSSTNQQECIYYGSKPIAPEEDDQTYDVGENFTSDRTTRLSTTTHPASRLPVILRDVDRLALKEAGSGRIIPYFPDPENMPGSFTNALCQLTQFVVQPCISLTLTDEEESQHDAKQSMSKMLHHFEIGLDGVEGIIRGQVAIPASREWTQMADQRLNPLHSIIQGVNRQHARSAASPDLEGYTRPVWVFFGIKFKQSGKEKKKGSGRWVCFGAPAESFRRCDGGDVQHRVIPLGLQCPEEQPFIRRAHVSRLSVRMSAGGPGCMDLYKGAEDYADGLWEMVQQKMGRVDLGVTVLLHQGLADS